MLFNHPHTTKYHPFYDFLMLRHKILNRIVWKKRLKLTVKLCCQCWIFTFHLSIRSLMALTHIWKNEVPDIWDMRYTTQPNMPVTGIHSLMLIFQKIIRRKTLQYGYVSCCQKTCTRHFPLTKNWSIIQIIGLAISNSVFLLRAPLLMLYLSCSFQCSDCNEKSLPLLSKYNFILDFF